MVTIKHGKNFKEFILYVIIGAVAVGADNIVFLLLRTFNLNLYLTNFISVNCGLSVSFVLNTRFNFKKKDNIKRRALNFYGIGYIGLVISMCILTWGISILRIYEWLIKLLSTIIVGLFQFSLNKLITFREI